MENGGSCLKVKKQCIWDQVSLQTKWQLETCTKPKDTIVPPSNETPRSNDMTSKASAPNTHVQGCSDNTIEPSALINNGTDDPQHVKNEVPSEGVTLLFWTRIRAQP